MKVKFFEMNLYDHVMTTLDSICDLTEGRVMSLNFFLNNVNAKNVNTGLFYDVFNVQSFVGLMALLTDMDRFDELHEFGGFEFEGESEDGKFYCDSVPEFQMLTKFLPLEEVGISFSGEIKIDEKTSVITDKQIKLDNSEVAIKTYQKVMEMRELTEAERTNVGKAKLFLKKLFEVFFKGQKWRRNLCIFYASLVAFDIAVDNYFGALMMTACILLYTSPIKFAKELKKIFGNKKRKKELSDELSELHLLSDVYSVDEDEGVQLYFKPKASNV